MTLDLFAVDNIARRSLTLWRVIPGTQGFYHISTQGQLKYLGKQSRKLNLLSKFSESFEQVEVLKLKLKLGRCRLNVPCVKLVRHGLKELVPVSSLMFEAFHGISGLSPKEILHIDGDEFNLELKNLILCVPDDKLKYLQKLNLINNREKDVKVSKSELKELFAYPSSIPVSKYSIDGLLLKVYENLHVALNAEVLGRTEIQKVLEGIKSLKHQNAIYKFGVGPAVIDTQLITGNTILLNPPKERMKEFVLKFTYLGELVEIYNNLYEAAYNNHVSISDIKEFITKSKFLNGNFYILFN